MTDEGNKVKQTMNIELRGTRAKGRPSIRHGMDKCCLGERNSKDRRWRKLGQYITLTWYHTWAREKKNGVYITCMEIKNETDG